MNYIKAASEWHRPRACGLCVSSGWSSAEYRTCGLPHDEGWIPVMLNLCRAVMMWKGVLLLENNVFIPFCLFLFLAIPLSMPHQASRSCRGFRLMTCIRGCGPNLSWLIRLLRSCWCSSLMKEPGAFLLSFTNESVHVQSSGLVSGRAGFTSPLNS